MVSDPLKIVVSLIVASLLSHLNSSNAFHWPSLPPRTNQRNQHVHSLNAHPSRRECVSALTSAITVVTPASVIALMTTSQPALAAPSSRKAADADATMASLNYNGVYTDPQHPKGSRVLIGNDKSATLILQDDPSGEVYKLPIQVEMSAESEQGVAKQFVFDFSPKGGPSSIIGTFTKDKEGIPLVTFQDGNTWKKRETGPIGVYRDGLDTKKVYAIRQLKGPELTVDITTNGGESSTAIRAKAGNPTITFEFPGIEGGGVPGVFSMKKKIISFEDGNVWTKL